MGASPPPAKQAPAPQGAQGASQGGGMFGGSGLGSMFATGAALGVGSAVGHAAVGALTGGRDGGSGGAEAAPEERYRYGDDLVVDSTGNRVNRYACEDEQQQFFQCLSQNSGNIGD